MAGRSARTAVLCRYIGSARSRCRLGEDAGDQDYLAYGALVVYACSDPALTDAADETIAEALHQIVELSGSDIVLIGSTLSGRAVAAQLAQEAGRRLHYRRQWCPL